MLHIPSFLTFHADMDAHRAAEINKRRSDFIKYLNKELLGADPRAGVFKLTFHSPPLSLPELQQHYRGYYTITMEKSYNWYCGLLVCWCCNRECLRDDTIVFRW